MNKSASLKIILVLFSISVVTFAALILSLRNYYYIAISLYIVPVMLSAYFWGFWKGALVSIISEFTLISSTFILSPESFSISMISLGIIFFIFSLVICQLFRLRTRLEAEHLQLIAKETKMNALFKAVPDAIVIIDTKKKTIVESNNAAEALFGFSEETMTEKKCYEYICGLDEKDCPFCNLGNRMDRTQQVIVNASGKSVSVIRSVKNLLVDGSVYIIVCYSDISELKQTQYQLDNTNNKYSNLFDDLPIPMYRVESNGKITNVNEAFLKVMHIPENEMISEYKIEDFFKRSIEREYFISLINKENLITNMEIRFSRIDGSDFSGLTTAHLVHELDGDVYIEGSIIDITMIRELEIKQKELEGLTNRNIHMDSITNLAAGMAHDINNILAGIYGHAQVIKHKLKDSSIENNLVRIVQGVEKADSILMGLLTSIGSYSYSPELIDLNIFTASLLYELEEKYLDVEQYNYYGSDEKILVNIDKVLVKEMVLEIIKNALKASDQKKKILITTGYEKPENVVFSFLKSTSEKSAYISITDMGSGIDEKIIHRIFEPYYTTEDFGSGAGLGLTKVYGITQRHEGAIGIKTGPEEGTSMTIYFEKSTGNY